MTNQADVRGQWQAESYRVWAAGIRWETYWRIREGSQVIALGLSERVAISVAADHDAAQTVAELLAALREIRSHARRGAWLEVTNRIDAAISAAEAKGYK
jgi:hypothetical protein